MKPLRLTWHLSSPIATSSSPIHLDALVAFAVTESRLRKAIYGEPDAPDPSSCVRDLANELPIGRFERDGHSVWQASALVPVSTDEMSHGMRFWTRKTDPYDYADRLMKGHLTQTAKQPMKPFAIKVDTARGLLKQQFKHYPVKQIGAVQAWCIGDIDALQGLLDPAWGGVVSHIGPRGRSGLGRIQSFEIVEDDAALERWKERVLPWAHEGSVPLQMATTFPYWEVSNQRQAHMNPALLF